MTTERTFTAVHLGPVDLNSPTGTVRVSADPKLTAAMVVVRTKDDTGVSADAVNATRFSNESDGTLMVRVPEIRSTTQNTVRRSSNGNVIVTQTIGTVHAGQRITGLTIGSDGTMTFGAGSRVTLGDGTTIGSSEIEVLVFLPIPAALRLKTVSADLEARGHLAAVHFTSISGDITGGDIDQLTVSTTSGDVDVSRVSALLSVKSVSGDIEVNRYEGSDAQVTTVSGDVEITATARAAGRLQATSVSGDVDLRGSAALDVRASTVSGRKRIR
ncbi:DUF4097 family beta strand repeat-containing protein [Streptacidiphilus sp. EB129]|uniref:DUF4097 family beta strand repeat-containing protein n=1 Tax=Streptacidiphilus sp. EB129 TaxID=3156262 RepID=UPI0035167787